MSVEWEDSLSPQLRRIAAMAADMTEDAAAGGDYILEGALERVPKRSGSLAKSGKVNKDRGGRNTVAITFDGPYARWIHEHLGFKHPAGGEAKFLERSMRMRRVGAVKRALNHFWERI